MGWLCVHWSLAGEKLPADDKSFIPAGTGLSQLISGGWTHRRESHRSDGVPARQSGRAKEHWRVNDPAIRTQRCRYALTNFIPCFFGSKSAGNLVRKS